MKILKYFIWLSLFAAVSLSQNACSDKDDGDPQGNNGGVTDGRWTEEGNKLIYRETYDLGYGVSYSGVWTLTFDGDKCVASKCEMTFGSAQLADAFYNNYRNEQCPATKSGRTVTIDYTALHKGLSKAQIKSAIESSGDLS